MVDAISNIQGYSGYTYYNPTFQQQVQNNNLYNLFDNLTPNGDYDGDIMMSKIDFSQDITQNMHSQSASLQQYPQQSVSESTLTPKATQGVQFSGREQNQTQIEQPLDNYLVTREQQPICHKNTGKVVGTVVGASLPLASKIPSILKNGIKVLSKWKPLALTSAIVALGGYGIGAFIDNLRNNQTQSSQQLTETEQRELALQMINTNSQQLKYKA